MNERRKTSHQRENVFAYAEEHENKATGKKKVSTAKLDHVEWLSELTEM